MLYLSKVSRMVTARQDKLDCGGKYRRSKTPTWTKVLPPRYERFQLTSAAVKWRYPVLSCTHTVVKAPKSPHISPILRSLHWLKINERIENKPLSHHISLSLPFTPYLTLISFISQILSSIDTLIPSGLPSWLLT